MHTYSTAKLFILPLVRYLSARASELNNSYKTSGRLVTSQNVFDRVPNELILEVASWLPYSCAASLALYNHKLFFALGGPIFTMLNGDTPQRALFLRSVGKDLLDTFFCSRCGKLHILVPNRWRKFNAKKRYSRTWDSRCKAASLEESLGDAEAALCSNSFTLEHVQVATKLFRHGLCFEGNQNLELATITKPTFNTVGSLPDTWGFQLSSHSLLVTKSAFVPKRAYWSRKRKAMLCPATLPLPPSSVII